MCRSVVLTRGVGSKYLRESLFVFVQRVNSVFLKEIISYQISNDIITYDMISHVHRRKLEARLASVRALNVITGTG